MTLARKRFSARFARSQLSRLKRALDDHYPNGSTRRPTVMVDGVTGEIVLIFKRAMAGKLDGAMFLIRLDEY